MPPITIALPRQQQHNYRQLAVLLQLLPPQEQKESIEVAEILGELPIVRRQPEYRRQLKVNSLISCLSGPAKQLWKAIQVTATNYEVVEKIF
uniref:Uncharacterized protein n=1 Tax=Ditylenchus dipsaci TaxID=166011 RepID=A0A915EPG6_9BILA